MDKILSPIKARIIQFIEKQGLTKENFFEELGIAATNFRGKGLSSEIGGDKIVKILTHFKELNPEWLILGIGNMLRDIDVNKSEDAAEEALRNERIEELKSALKDKDQIILLMQRELSRLRNGNTPGTKLQNKPGK